jgi:hypothetical protein
MGYGSWKSPLRPLGSAYDRPAMDAQGFCYLTIFPRSGKNVQLKVCNHARNRKTKHQQIGLKMEV